MKILKDATAVGILTIAVAILFYYGYNLVTEDKGEKNTNLFFAFFEDASGIVPNTRILLAGVVVGYIKEIKLIENRAKVSFTIKKDIILYGDASVAKKPASLLGEYIIVLFPHCTSAFYPCKGDPNKILQSGSEILNVGFLSPLEAYIPGMGKMTERMDRIMGHIESASNDIEKLLRVTTETLASKQAQENLEKILYNITEITDSLNQLLKQNQLLVSKSIKNIEQVTSTINPEEIRKIISHVSSITAQLEDFIGGGEEEERQSTLKLINESIKELKNATEKLSATLTHIENITEDVDTGERNILDLLVGEEISHDITGLIEDAEQFISPMIRLQTVVGLRSEYNFFDNSFKTYVQLRLQPREDKYYLLEFIDDPRGLIKTTDTFIETNNPDYPPVYQERRTTKTESFRFSFMFARRLKIFTFRFGIKESTGGIGIDLHLLNDRLELTTDLFSFGTDTYPRWKLMAALEFLRGVSIVGGADDILNENRDYFIGIQIRFIDEDIKGMLMFAPTGMLTGQ